jgi:plasmid stabilization system protein ParE
MARNTGYGLHPLAAQDITDIWEFIAADNPRAAGRIREELIEKIQSLVAFPHQGLQRPELTTLPLRFKLVREYVTLMRPTKSLCGSWRFFTAGGNPGLLP